MNHNFKLTSTVTEAAYLNMLERRDSDGLSKFIEQRFTERFITSLQEDTKRKNGFCIMAVSCLMIESLESFWHGWPDTSRRGMSAYAFCSFFDRHGNFSIFRGHAEEFYKNVRCGILHQAETCGGWRIHRSGPLFDASEKVVNATKFHLELQSAIKEYQNTLASSPWESAVWQNFVKKMKAILENCNK